MDCKLDALVELEKTKITKGIIWRNEDNLIAKIREEVEEFIEAIAKRCCEAQIVFKDKSEQEKEFADLLHSIVALVYYRQLDTEKAIADLSSRLLRRIEEVEKLADRPLVELSDDEQTALLKQVKHLPGCR
jgi:NTP pyrophosphatase (non-canonical NTP hydrolase)